MQVLRSWTRGARTVASTMVCGAVLLSSPAAMAKLCVTAPLEAAIHARLLQTELMVAALYCGSSADYNAFIKRYGHALVGAGDSVKEAFAAEYGKGYRKPWDTWLTGMANEASLRSLESNGQFCGQTAAMFHALNGGSVVADLADFAGLQSFASQHGLQVCPDYALQIAQRSEKTAQGAADVAVAVNKVIPTPIFAAPPHYRP